MGANKSDAEDIADKIERRIYNGIPTTKVLQMIFQFMRKYKPYAHRLFDLRKGLILMNSKPEFEMFVQVLLRQMGFEVSGNHVLKGKCVNHEVDAVAVKNAVTYLVEAKHHLNYHHFTGLDESRIARAVLEDVTEAYKVGMSDLKIDRAMIVTNTKYSEHAMQYGTCRNILQIGWSTPKSINLRDIIRENNLYPLSCVKDLKTETRTKLVNSGVILIKQLIDEDAITLAENTGLPKEILTRIKEKIAPVSFSR
jgi:hypothetical protein